MQLTAALTDIWGEPVARIWQFSDLEVNDVLCDTATAKLKIAMTDAAMPEVKPVERLLKVTYGPFLVFWGHITRPSFNYDENTVEVNAHDPTFKLKHHFHRYGDIVVDYGYPMDGIGLRQLIESSIPIEPQLDRDIPGNGILWGNDTTWKQAPKGELNDEGPTAGEKSQWRRCERGANIWETITNMRESVGAPEFWFRPVDMEHPGINEDVPPGFFCELDTAPRIGSDQTEEVQFEYGFGRLSADNVVEEPDGDVMRNYWAQVNPGGEKVPADDKNRALVHNEASWLRFGIFGGYESSQQKDTPEVLQDMARAWVRAYAFPPTFVTVTPAIDRPGVPLYRQDFITGDNVQVRGKRGLRSVDMPVRVIRTTLRQVDPFSNTRTELECVPGLGTSDEGEET